MANRRRLSGVPPSDCSSTNKCRRKGDSRQESGTAVHDHLTFEVRGGLRLAARRPFDRGVRRMRLSNEMPGTRHRQRNGEVARMPLGRTNACGDLLHFGSYNWTDHWRAWIALYFHLGSQAGQHWSSRGLRASADSPDRRWAALGLQNA
jgi:hypothetical protein